MKRLSIIALILLLPACALLNKAMQDTCMGEASAHAVYLRDVAPFRSADRVALELTNYTQISAACVAGDPLGVLLSLVSAAKSLRK